MFRSIRRWFETSLIKFLRKTHCTTLSRLVVGAIQSKRLGIAAIAEEVPGKGSEKSHVKLVDRFLGNERVDPWDTSRALIHSLKLAAGERIAIAIDWTTIGNFEVLVSAVITRHRAIPVFWTVIDTQITRQVVAQEEHIKRLKDLIPVGVDVVILADRGFDAVDFIQVVTDAGFGYVIRLANTTNVRRGLDREFQTLGSVPIKRGRVHELGTVDFRQGDPVPLRLVITHDWRQETPWYLATNLADVGRKIVALYGRRFEIEEAFKDLKDLRAGLQLRDYKMTKPDRLSRLLIVGAVAYLFMVLAGMFAEDHQLHKGYQCNTSQERVLAMWRVGRRVLRKGLATLEQLLSYRSAVACRI